MFVTISARQNSTYLYEHYLTLVYYPVSIKIKDASQSPLGCEAGHVAVGYQCFRGVTLKMEAARSSETLVPYHNTT
jgi:hypothetical protein